MNTVLVVDDDKVFSGLLKTIFELEGYRAVIVLRPDEVVPTARRVKPVLVLMD
ncbi:MAG TPA: DNA-binding response regulator, partial [Thermoflexia bacterium]|nr:DNA-binding response regulator [Thermoflexia bacterium]